MLTRNGRTPTGGGQGGKAACHSLSVSLCAYDSSGHGDSKDRRELHYVLCVLGRRGNLDKKTKELKES
jgi:hypothetical protein